MLPVAATCSWLLEPQSFCLTYGLFQNLSHRATGHRAAVVPGTWMWLTQARLQVGLGEGSRSGPSTEFSSVLARHQPVLEKGNLWL